MSHLLLSLAPSLGVAVLGALGALWLCRPAPSPDRAAPVRLWACDACGEAQPAEALVPSCMDGHDFLFCADDDACVAARRRLTPPHLMPSPDWASSADIPF